MRAPDWLTARPIAHRGLHDRSRGVMENMPAAVTAAIEGNYAIEVDLQVTADGEAMVHHDYVLGRLTEGDGALREMSAASLKQVAFKDTTEHMMTLGDLCHLVAGRTPIIIEIKSHFDGDHRIVERMAEVLRSYPGPVAGMSFDADQVIALRHKMPSLPRGIIAQRTYEDHEWEQLSAEQRRAMLHLRHLPYTRPHFVAYWIEQLPAPAPWIARHLLGLPLLTWTVRTEEQRARADRHADQMIFEGIRPA